jgi:hypothetical protein
MPNLSATLRLRPVRMGFLVDPTDLASLRQVMELCTCLWGGIYNPIIPVCSAVPDIWKFIPALAPSAVQLAGGYINFFEPDVYVQAVPEIPPELNLSDGEIDFGSPRLLQLSSLTEEDPDTRDSLVGLSMLGVYQSLFDREYRFVPRHPANVAVLKGASPESQAFTECTLGAFPAAGRFALLANAYKDAFQPEEMESNATSWLLSPSRVIQLIVPPAVTALESPSFSCLTQAAGTIYSTFGTSAYSISTCFRSMFTGLRN